MFKIILLFALLFGLMPMFIFGQSKQGDTESEVKTDSLAFSVKGMTCGGCVAHVKNTMGKVEGVTACEVSLKDARADITYDPAKTDKQKIQKALKLTGFSIAEIASEIPKSGKDGEKTREEKNDK